MNLRQRKSNQNGLRFPVIRDKSLQVSAQPHSKGIRLERIGQKKNLMLMDIVKINKI